MKKTLIFAGAALLAMVSCTKEDSNEPLPESTPICFRPGLTRATETTNANLSSIVVSGFMNGQLMIDKETYSKGSDGVFTSANDYYWPGDDTPLTFYSYAPAAPGGTLTLTSDSKQLSGFSPAADIASQIDFITATGTGRKSTNEATGLALDFSHRLAQIEVRAKTDNDTYTYEVTGIRIGRPVSSGSFDFTTNSWALGSDKADYETTYSTPLTLNSTPQSVMGSAGNAMLIPQQLTGWDPQTDASNTAEGAYISIKLRIATAETGVQIYPFASNAECQWAAVKDDTKWEAGNKYIYTLDLTHGAGYVDPKDPDPGTPVLGGPIKFTVQVQPWTETTVEKPFDTGSESN
ncbi:MAG: fimbrillin family protein [Bacteroides sp.]|nr:fimbrillin family protein [Bacteroides sp.]